MISGLKHLKRLSEVKSGAGIPFLTPDVSPGTHCPMRMASVIVEDIEGLSSLLVGMPECATHSRLFSPHPEGPNGELHWLYVLDGREVVFGCRDGVMESLKKMDKAGAQAILVIATCIPDLIGEDFEGLLWELQPELKARVAFVMLGQFKNLSYPAGSWKTIHALGGLMERQDTDQYRVNILGRSPKEEHIPMPSLFPFLERSGLSLRYLAPGATFADFRTAPDAALNIVISPYTEPLAAIMKKEFGIPFISLHTCFGVEEIDRAYSDAAEHFGLSIENTFEKERREALSLEKHAAEMCRGLSCAMALRLDLPLPLTRYLITTLGMKPLLLHLEEYYPEDAVHAKAIQASGHNPFICRIVNEYTALPILKELCPDICFGYLPNADDELSWSADMFDFYGQAGYGRTIALLERLLPAVEKAVAARTGGTYGTASL